jgi:hypothetical protein
VKIGEFDTELRSAAEAGLTLVTRPRIGRSHAALLEKAC